MWKWFVNILVLVCLFMIFLSQTFLVYDYYKNTRESLVKEVDVVIHEIFKRDLEARRTLYKKTHDEDTSKAIPPLQKEKITRFDFRKETSYNKNPLDLIDIAINMHISREYPANITGLIAV